MAEKKDIHIGPLNSITHTSDGTTVSHEIHMTEGYSKAEVAEALSENYGLDPDSFAVRSIPKYTGSKGRTVTSFSGNWAGSNWEPTGPKKNYGYNPSMN